MADETEQLTKAIDEGAKHAATVSFTFLGFAIYLAIVIGSTRDAQFLRETPIHLPLLSAELPIIGFFFVVPWLLVVLHFHLLLNLYLLSRNIHRLNDLLSTTGKQNEISTQLWPFPFSHALASKQPLTTYVCSTVVWLGVMVAPMILLIWAEIRSLPYHSEGLAYSQFAAVLVDATVLAMFWPATIMPAGQVLNWWRSAITPRLSDLWNTLRGETHRVAGDLWVRTAASLTQTENRATAVPSAWPLFTVILTGPVLAALGLFTVAQLPYWYSPDRPALARFARVSVSNECLASVHVSIEPLSPGEPEGRTWRARLLNLDLDELVLSQGEIKPETLALLADGNPASVKSNLTQIAGILLKNADLRGASLVRARLPKADLRNANLQGANLEEVKLQGANLEGVNLIGADLGGANLQGALLTEADLRGANLGEADLRGAMLDRAKMQGAYLNGAQLQGASLRGAMLQCSYLRDAKLHGADLFAANLLGAELGGARFNGASLVEAKLQGAEIGGGTYFTGSDLFKAQLECSRIIGSDFQGANLVRARLGRAYILNTSFEFTDFREIRLGDVDDTDGRDALNNQFISTRCPRAKLEVSGSSSDTARCDQQKWEFCQKSQGGDDYFKGLAKLLVQQGCRDENVGAGIAARLIFEDVSAEIPSAQATLGPISASVAEQLLAPDCAASKVLSAEAKVRIRGIMNTRR